MKTTRNPRDGHTSHVPITSKCSERTPPRLPLSSQKTVLLSFLFLGLVLFANSVTAQSPIYTGSQWQSVGGKIVASGKHFFKESSPASGVLKGTITLQGPGYIGCVRKVFYSIGPSVWLKESFVYRELGVQSLLRGADGNWHWYPPKLVFENYIPNANKGGWVPKPTKDKPTTTLQLWVGVEGGGRKNDNRAIQYELWYFPLAGEGGKIIKSLNEGPNDPPDGPGNPPVVNTGGGASTPAIADSHVYSYNYQNWNRCNWGAYDILGAGWNPAGGEKRMYLKFGLTGVKIPSGKRAKLRLFHNHTGGSPSLPLSVYRVTQAWNEGRGIYHSGAVEPTAAPGTISWILQPAYNTHPVARFSPGTRVNKYVDVDITELVQSWLTGQPNHGLAIAPVRLEGGGNRESVYGFYSREYKDAAKRPALIIGNPGDTPGGQVNNGNDPPDGPAKPDTPPVVKPGTGVIPGGNTMPPPPDGALQVRADHKQVTKGTTFYVPVWLDFPKTFPRTRDGRVNVANLNVEISYNPNVLKAGTKTMAGNALGGALFQANSQQPGIIKLGFASKKGVQTTGTLAQLIFQATGQPGQRSPLTVRISTVNDAQGRTPKTKVIHGYVDILKTAILGDYNGNGYVDAGDALAALKMSVGIIPQNMILNVDKMDQVTSNDARLLLQMAVQGGTNTNPPPKVNNPPPKRPVVDTPTKTPAVVTSTTADARRAYQEYIAAYNKMTSLMAKGQGDTPAAKQAYAAYKAAKDKYEAAIKNQPTKEGVR